MDAGVSVNEDAFRGKALGAVTGDGVAVVEMTMVAGFELDLAVVVQAGGNVTIGTDRFDGSEVAVGNTKGFVGGGELNAVAHGELPFDLPIDADAC